LTTSPIRSDAIEKKMTDKDIELLFKSVDNFETFDRNVNQRQNIRLKNGIDIEFTSSNNVEFHLPNRKLTVDNLRFQRIISDLSFERANQDNQESAKKTKLTGDRIRNEIFELGNNKFKVHNEYIENMYFSSDIASAHGAYLNKLRDLIRIFHRDNILIIDSKEFSTEDQLIDFLKSYGFKYIDKDLKLE
jgi:hypothetical protein